MTRVGQDRRTRRAFMSRWWKGKEEKSTGTTNGYEDTGRHSERTIIARYTPSYLSMEARARASSSMQMTTRLSVTLRPTGVGNRDDCEA